MASPTKPNVVSFGAYEFNPYSKELRKEGMRVRLEGQPLAILEILLDRQGELVTREELQKMLWPADTFVDFEHSLNAAVKRLRAALNDSADQPRFIETLARRGYRFVAPVNSFVAEPKTERAVLVPTESQAPIPVGFRLPGGVVSIRLRVLLGAVVVLTLSTIALVLNRGASYRGVGPPKIKSLAVLPMKNLSADPAQEYFADGMTEAVIERLSLIPDLRVISRTSVLPFKGSRMSAPEIAKALHVDALVEGSVIREGTTVRVHSQLIRASTDEHSWSATYDRELGDALQLEGELSRAIANEVGIKLTPQVQHRLEHKSTMNPEAHDAYLRARYFLDKDDKEGATKCVQYFQEAVAKDPSYAAAYAGLYRCYDLAYSFDMLSSSERESKEKAAILKAVELDDGLAEAHSGLGDYYFEYAWDFNAAQQEYKRALELDPNSPTVHEDYSFFLQRMGRADEAVREIKRARELDPLSLHEADSVGWALLYTRRYDEAVDQFHKVLEMDPTYRRSMWGLARVYEVKGMYKEAIAECLKIPALPGMAPFSKALFKSRCSLYQKVYSTSGRPHVNRRWSESAGQEIRDYLKASDDDFYFIAALQAESGEDRQALDFLERTYVRRDSDLVQLKVDPRMDNLRSNPRFQDLLGRMNFPE